MNKKRATRIKRHLPPVGTFLVAIYKGQSYEARIVEAPDFPDKKGIKFGKVLYSSMTAAAISVTKCSTNGWRFWKIGKAE